MEVHGAVSREAVLTEVPPRLRIACSGLVGAEHGSAAAMGFQVLRELLNRGHEVDFFSKHTYVHPEHFLAHPGFTYHDCDQPIVESLLSRVRNEPLQWLGRRIGNAMYMRRIVHAMARLHHERVYDSELFLGQWAYGRVPRLPVVSWVQGAPGTDSRSVIRHAHAIRALCGKAEYARLRAYSVYRGSRFGRPPFRHTDISICGSAVSRQTLVHSYGLAPLSVRVIPYPIDLDAFRPVASEREPTTSELLWVGRIVPRKRLDLFLNAGAQLISDGVDVRLTVVGGFPFAAGYHALIERFPFPDRLTYLPALPHEEVRRRMQSATILVQPSEEEDFGSSIAEALACGTPVVVGPSNGTGQYIGNGGESFGEYTAASVAEAIERILRVCTPTACPLRLEARKAAVRHFRIRDVVDSLEEILCTAAGRGTA